MTTFTQESEALRIASGDLIDSRRRTPEHCIYCTEAPGTKEHSVTNAIGGRLWAHILCSNHNSIINTAADEVLNRNFAPFVTMLQVPRQRGGIGAEFAAKDDDGTPLSISPQSFAKQKRRLKVQEHDSDGRILRAGGDIDRLDQRPAQVNFSVSSYGEKIRGALLKIAFHFFTGFVADAPMKEALHLLPFILGKQEATQYVRTPFLSEEIFADSWPPRHEVTCYPYEGRSLVTILLFGAYAYDCLLPFNITATHGIRYRQVLTKNYHPELYDVPIPSSLDWNKLPSGADDETWAAPFRERRNRLYCHGIQTFTRARCKRAMDCASNASSNYGNFWERYRGELRIEGFTAEEIASIVMIGQHLEKEGKNVWEVPVEVKFREQPSE